MGHFTWFRWDITPEKERLRFLGVPLWSCHFLPDRRRYFLLGVPLVDRVGHYQGPAYWQHLAEARDAISLAMKEQIAKTQAVLQQEIQQTLTSVLTCLHLPAAQTAWRLQKQATTAILHQQTFGPFRNRHQGQTVVLLGCAPSLNQYQPIKNAVHVGVNRAFLFHKVALDYLFCADVGGCDAEYLERFVAYEGNHCQKFLGDMSCGGLYPTVGHIISESLARRMNQALRYKVDPMLLPSPSQPFPLDIETEPLYGGGSIAFHALQFILHTNPAKVYLVGMDCINNGYFTDHTPDAQAPFDFEGVGIDRDQRYMEHQAVWRQLKTFAEVFYPATEIISINPVGLKGIFRDVYTDNDLAMTVMYSSNSVVDHP